MDPGTRRLFIAAVALIVVVTGGIALFLGGPGAPAAATLAPSGPPATAGATSPGASASPGASLAIPTSPVRGVIVAVDSRGLDDVRGFTLRSDAGAILVFDLREMRDTATFPLGHLAEHQATAEPVLVSFRDEAGVLIATEVDDA